MSRDKCPKANPECRYAPRCFSDEDHIVPQRYKSIDWITRLYIYTPENKQQICRAEHDEKNRYSHITESRSLIPSHEEMAGPILDAWRRGDIRLKDTRVEYLISLTLMQGEVTIQGCEDGTRS